LETLIISGKTHRRILVYKGWVVVFDAASPPAGGLIAFKREEKNVKCPISNFQRPMKSALDGFLIGYSTLDNLK
jgi:hypothetical protein